MSARRRLDGGRRKQRFLLMKIQLEKTVEVVTIFHSRQYL